MQSYFCSYFCS